MNAMRPRLMFGRFFSSGAAGVALAAYLCLAGPSLLAQNGGNADHWVGTWATAVVARLQGPQGALQGFGPPPQGQALQGQPRQGQPPQAQTVQTQDLAI